MTVVLASVAFWFPFTYRLIGDDGKPEEVKGRARFKRLKKSERQALDRRIYANSLTPEIRKTLREQLAAQDCPFNKRERAEVEAGLAAETLTDAELLTELLVDWELKDRQGTPILYSPAAVAEACEEWDGLESDIVRGYNAARAAAFDPKAVEKNSEPPPATGS